MHKEFDSNENTARHELNTNRRVFLRNSAAFTMGLGLLQPIQVHHLNRKIYSLRMRRLTG